MTRRRATLRDVARHAGVSSTTASFVMTGRRDMRISPAAEQRVLQAARELDYRPNLLAKSLRTNLSQTIGLISDVVASEAFAGQLIRGCMTTALLHEHLLFVGESEGDPQLAEQLVRSMLDRGVGGFLYASMDTREVEVPAVLDRERLVLLNCRDPRRQAPAVLPGEEAAGADAVRVLLAAGHTDGIHLVGEVLDHVIAGVERRRGAVAALAYAGRGFAGEVPVIWWPEPAYRGVRELLDRDRDVTALLCLNDRIAMGALQAIVDAGLSVPADISLVSFDDSDLAAWMRPGVTSLAIPHLEMGRRATELLLAPDPEPTVHRIALPVVHRHSVAAARTV